MSTATQTMPVRTMGATRNYKVIFNFKPQHSDHVEKRAGIVSIIDGYTTMEDIPSILEARWSGEVTEVLSTTAYNK